MNRQQNGNMRQQRRRRSLDPAVLTAIHESAVLGTSAAQIHAQLVDEFGEWVPSVRTVQDIVKEVKVHDSSDRWSLVNSDPGTVGIVLPVLAAVIRRSKGRRFLTTAEARWVVRVRKAAPDLPAIAIYQLARLYMQRQESGHSVADLDSFLAFAPWRGRAFWNSYKEAAEERWIERPILPWTFGQYRDMLHRLGLTDASLDEKPVDFEKLMQPGDELV